MCPPRAALSVAAVSPFNRKGRLRSETSILIPAKDPSCLARLAPNLILSSIRRKFKYKSENEIFGEGEPADYLYQVVEGAVRTHKLLSDGRHPDRNPPFILPRMI
jgi:CRP-like cAMP-binding protein